VEEGVYINIWPEDIVGLLVDGELCEVPHVCAFNTVLVESRFCLVIDHFNSPLALSHNGMYLVQRNTTKLLFAHNKHLFTFQLFIDTWTLF
jgi:hypothetical protein